MSYIDFCCSNDENFKLGTIKEMTSSSIPLFELISQAESDLVSENYLDRSKAIEFVSLLVMNYPFPTNTNFDPIFKFLLAKLEECLSLAFLLPALSFSVKKVQNTFSSVIAAVSANFQVRNENNAMRRLFYELFYNSLLNSNEINSSDLTKILSIVEGENIRSNLDVVIRILHRLLQPLSEACINSDLPFIDASLSYFSQVFTDSDNVSDLYESFLKSLLQLLRKDQSMILQRLLNNLSSDNSSIRSAVYSFILDIINHFNADTAMKHIGEILLAFVKNVDISNENECKQFSQIVLILTEKIDCYSKQCLCFTETLNGEDSLVIDQLYEMTKDNIWFLSILAQNQSISKHILQRSIDHRHYYQILHKVSRFSVSLNPAFIVDHLEHYFSYLYNNLTLNNFTESEVLSFLEIVSDCFSTFAPLEIRSAIPFLKLIYFLEQNDSIYKTFVIEKIICKVPDEIEAQELFRDILFEETAVFRFLPLVDKFPKIFKVLLEQWKTRLNTLQFNNSLIHFLPCSNNLVKDVEFYYSQKCLTMQQLFDFVMDTARSDEVSRLVSNGKFSIEWLNFLFLDTIPIECCIGLEDLEIGRVSKICSIAFYFKCDTDFDSVEEFRVNRKSNCQKINYEQHFIWYLIAQYFKSDGFNFDFCSKMTALYILVDEIASEEEFVLIQKVTKSAVSRNSICKRLMNFFINSEQICDTDHFKSLCRVYSLVDDLKFKESLFKTIADSLNDNSDLSTVLLLLADAETLNQLPNYFQSLSSVLFKQFSRFSIGERERILEYFDKNIQLIANISKDYVRFVLRNMIKLQCDYKRIIREKISNVINKYYLIDAEL